MKHMAIAELNDGVMSTMNVMTQLMRLHQITCGHFKADDGTITFKKQSDRHSYGTVRRNRGQSYNLGKLRGGYKKHSRC